MWLWFLRSIVNKKEVFLSKANVCILTAKIKKLSLRSRKICKELEIVLLTSVQVTLGHAVCIIYYEGYRDGKFLSSEKSALNNVSSFLCCNSNFLTSLCYEYAIWTAGSISNLFDIIKNNGPLISCTLPALLNALVIIMY